MDTEGLLVLTNDGDLAHRLTHPSFGVPKEYLVEVEGEPTAGEVRRLREGVELDDGPTAPARVAVVAPDAAAHRHPRGSQPPGPADVRGRRPSRASGWSGPGSDRWPIPRLGPGCYRPLTFDEVRSLAAAALPTAEEGRPGLHGDADPAVGPFDGPE